MNRTLVLLLVIVVAFQGFTILAPAKSALFSTGSPPKVVCVPFHGTDPGIPHDASIVNETVLKGTAHDPDGDNSLDFYRWEFGDGYSTDWAPVVDPYVIEARHVYNGTRENGTPYGPGTYFTAWLHVNDTSGNAGMDDYFVAIRDVSTPEKKLQVEVNMAIDNGLWWLHKQQIQGDYPDGAKYGYWNALYGYNVASTSACTEAFELWGHLPNGDTGEDPYVETVQRGLNYLFNQFHTYDVYQDPTYCPLGNPDTNGNGIGLGCYGPSEILYESGMALMTISSTGTPNRIAATGSANVVGRAYKDIVQDMIDWFAWGQSDPVSGVYEGGWRYQANYEQSDNSVSQWPVIGMEAAERNFGASGVTIPSFVRPELLKWLAYSQGGDGGFGYQAPGSWENTAKTGAGCAMLNWTGVPTTDAKFQSALGFLDADWYNTANSYTNLGDYYTMYAIMKGMRIPIPNVVSIGSHDWYAEYARYIVDEQSSYGGEYVVDHSWLAAYLSAEHATAWALATLMLTVVTPGPVAEAGSDVDNHPPTIPIKFDASGSYHRDPAKSIVLYEWDFEDDGTWDYNGTDPIVWHSYPAYYIPPDNTTIDWDLTEKNYTATLRVTDNSNPALQDTDTRVVHITAPPWKPVADPNGPYYGRIGVPIQLNGSGSYFPVSNESDPWYRNITKYEWDLDGDGIFDDAIGPNPIWTWMNNGTLPIGLRVTASPPVDDEHDTDTESTHVVIGASIEAKVDYCPQILNLGSKGNWGSVYIELPESYNVSEINVSTIRVSSVVPSDLGVPPVIGDYDGDGHQDLKVKLNRTALSQFILGLNVTIGTVELTLTGQLFDGTQLEGSDAIRVRMAGDADMDGRVNIIDCIVAANYFGKTVTCMDQGAVADENEDGRINVLDLILIARNFGRTYS